MPQRFLSIKNFEKYQTQDGKRTYPWIKLYKSLLTDREFLSLDITSRYIYVGLLILASETNNHIPNDVPYLSHRLSLGFQEGSSNGSVTFHKGSSNGSVTFHSGSTTVSQLDLKPLYRSGLLQASKTTKWRLDKSRVEKSRVDEIVHADQVACRQPSRQLTDDEWLVAQVRSNPAYSHLNIDQELGKMDAWLSTRPHKKKTRRFIINWLNRAEKPVNGCQADPLKAMANAFLERGA